MGTATKTLHGARVWAYGPDTKEPLGIFESVSSGVAYDHFEPFVLGRVSAGEVVLTGMMPVSVRLSGFRKIKEGPYSTKVAMTMLQNFFADDAEFVFVLRDRVTNDDIAVVVQSKIVGQNFNVAARSPMRLDLEVVGLRFYDEEGPQDEPINSAQY